MLALHVAVIAALSFVMGYAAKYVARSVARVSSALRLNGFVVSFGLLGLATSMPEISVAVFSATRGTPELSLGNLLGANVVLLTLLMGLAAIIAGRVGPGTLYKKHTLSYLVADVLLPVALLLDGRLTRLDGVLLTLAHVGFIAHLYRVQMRVAPRTMLKRRGRLARPIAIGLAASAVLLIASYFLVTSALVVAAEIGVPAVIIGLLLFAAGTNLPELTFVLTQSKAHKDVVVGDLLGSVVVNTPTLGLLALIHPFSVEHRAAVTASAAFVTGAVLLFAAFMRSKRSLDRREGYWLLAVYGAFVAYYAVTLGF